MKREKIKLFHKFIAYNNPYVLGSHTSLDKITTFHFFSDEIKFSR